MRPESVALSWSCWAPDMDRSEFADQLRLEAPAIWRPKIGRRRFLATLVELTASRAAGGAEAPERLCGCLGHLL